MARPPAQRKLEQGIGPFEYRGGAEALLAGDDYACAAFVTGAGRRRLTRRRGVGGYPLGTYRRGHQRPDAGQEPAGPQRRTACMTTTIDALDADWQLKACLLYTSPS